MPTTLKLKSFDRQVRVARGDIRHVRFMQRRADRFAIKVEGLRSLVRVRPTNKAEDLDLGLKWVARAGDIEIFGRTAKGAFVRFCKTVFKH